MNRYLSLGGFAASFLLCGLARGQTSGPASEESSAREHFQTGVARVQAGDLDAAIREFESAYAAQPHYSVLYNIAQAEAGLGRTPLAISSFERYLQEGGEKIPKGRRAEVEAFLDSARKRVGAVQIVLATSKPLYIWLDGTEVSADSLGAPIAVNVGQHRLLYWNVDGGPPTVLEIHVESANTTVARLALPSSPSPLPQVVPSVGQLRVNCAVPGMNIEVNGTKLAETPLANPLLITAGNAQVHISRPGYAAVDRRLAIGPNQVTVVTCPSQPLLRLQPEVRARLSVRTSAAGARVSVDGREMAQPAVLPFGPHDLSVDAVDFLPHKRRIVLESGKTLDYEVALRPTSHHLARARNQRTLGYALGGSGIALMAAAGALALWNGHRYDAWEAGPRTDLHRIASLQRTDDIAFGCVFAGVGLVIAGVWEFASVH